MMTICLEETPLNQILMDDSRCFVHQSLTMEDTIGIIKSFTRAGKYIHYIDILAVKLVFLLPYYSFCGGNDNAWSVVLNFTL